MSFLNSNLLFYGCAEYQFLVGKIAIPILALDVTLAVAVYLFSWLMLIAGIFFCGQEGLSYARLYYHHFKRSIKKSTLKGFNAVKTLKINKHDPSLDI